MNMEWNEKMERQNWTRLWLGHEVWFDCCLELDARTANAEKTQ